MKAIYTFTTNSKDDWRDGVEVTTIAEELSDAINNVVMMTGGDFKSENLRLLKVVDYELTINQSNIIERRLLVEERVSQVNVKHSGSIKGEPVVTVKS